MCVKRQTSPWQSCVGAVRLFQSLIFISDLSVHIREYTIILTMMNCSRNCNHMSKETRNHGGFGAGIRSKGSIIMKTVSILLVNSRRVCNQRKCTRDKCDDIHGRKQIGSRKMDDAGGKLNPKLLESLKKKTHFSK